MKHKCTPKCYDEGYEAGELEERKRILGIITSEIEIVEDYSQMEHFLFKLRKKIQETK